MDSFYLTGRTAVVTGGSRGIGRSITESLMEAGADVFVLSRTEPDGALVEFAAERARNISFRRMDLADISGVEQVVEGVLSDTKVDIIVNNAGMQERYPAIEFPMVSWDRVIDVNLRSVFRICQMFAKPMLSRGDGKIINIASLLSFQGGVNVVAYAASKGGVAQLTKALSNEWAGCGVNVNAIAPGYIVTEMNKSLLENPVRLEQISSRIPAGRWGRPEDLGGLAVFLASQAASYIHGQIVSVDGGWLAR